MNKIMSKFVTSVTQTLCLMFVFKFISFFESGFEIKMSAWLLFILQFYPKLNLIITIYNVHNNNLIIQLLKTHFLKHKF